MTVQGSSKIVDFGNNRKRACDFLLVINSNLGPILHRFWDTPISILHSHLTPSLGVNPFCVNLISPKLESLSYPSVKIRDPGLHHFDTAPESDGRTDNSVVANTGGGELCIASFANAW